MGRQLLTTLTTNWQLLAFGFLLQFFSISGQTVFISLFGGHLRMDLGLSHSQFGGYYSIATFMSALALAYTGKVTDQFNLRTLTPIIALLLALSCIMMAYTHYLWMLILCFFLLRQLGQGLLSLISITSVMRYIEKNRGSASSLVRMGYSFAEGIVPILVVALLMVLQWREIWLVMAAAIITIFIPISYYLLKNHHHRHRLYLENMQKTEQNLSLNNDIGLNENLQHNKQYSRRQVLSDPLFYLILPSLLCAPMLFTGFIFHQIQLLAEKQWALEWWSGVIFIYSSTGVAFLLSSGFIVDKFSARKTLFLVPLNLGIGLFILAYAEHSIMAIVAIIFISLASNTLSCLSAPLFVELYGTKHLGSIKALSTSIMVFSTSLSPFLIGYFLDAGFTFNSILLTGSLYCLIALLLLFLVNDGQKKI